jgi:ribonuclease P protein component
MSEPGSQPIPRTDDVSFGKLKKMRKTDEFSSVFRFRCVRAMAGIDFLAAPNGLTYSRLGMIVPKKIIPTAVARNRVKRLIRESFRLNQSELAGLDVVARIRSKTDEAKLMVVLHSGLKQCKACLTSRSKPNSQVVDAARQ